MFKVEPSIATLLLAAKMIPDYRIMLHDLLFSVGWRD